MKTIVLIFEYKMIFLSGFSTYTRMIPFGSDGRVVPVTGNKRECIENYPRTKKKNL